MSSVNPENQIPQVPQPQPQEAKGPEPQPQPPEAKGPEKKKQKKSYNDPWFTYNEDDWAIVKWFKSATFITGVVILSAITLPFIVVGAFLKMAFML